MTIWSGFTSNVSKPRSTPSNVNWDWTEFSVNRVYSVTPGFYVTIKRVWNGPCVFTLACRTSVCFHMNLVSWGLNSAHHHIKQGKHGRRARYHSHSQHHRGPELLISTLNSGLSRIMRIVNIGNAGKLFHFPVLWLQTCTPDQHLIKHTQVCLKSNLEQISQDRRIPWTWVRSIHTHTRPQYE